MPIDRTWFDDYIDDSGSGTDGSIINRETFEEFFDAIDLALAGGGFGGTVAGPPASVVGHLALWDNTAGTLLDDGGITVQGIIDAAVAAAGGGALAKHAATHAEGGSDAVTLTQAQVSGLSAALAGKASSTDPRFTDARTPTAHASTHAPTGGDPLPVDQAINIGSVRTLGTGAQQACPGNDARLSDTRTPKTHAATHASGGGDAITIAESQVTNLVTDLAAKVGTGDSRLSDARTPTAHAATHRSGGSDVLDVKLLGGFPGGSTNFLRGDGTFAIPPGGGGSGDVAGPAGAVNTDLAIFDGTTGKLLKDGGVAVANVARRDQANTFTGATVLQRTAESMITFIDTALPGDQRRWSAGVLGDGYFYIQPENDAGNYLTRALSISPAGALIAAQQIFTPAATINGQFKFTDPAQAANQKHWAFSPLGAAGDMQLLALDDVGAVQTTFAFKRDGRFTADIKKLGGYPGGNTTYLRGDATFGVPVFALASGEVMDDAVARLTARIDALEARLAALEAR